MILKFKECIPVIWAKIDFLVYLLAAGCIGGVVAWNSSQAKFIHDRAAWDTERLTLYAEREKLYDRIRGARTDEQNQCNKTVGDVRDDYKQRGAQWQKLIDALTLQVQNNNANSDNCHKELDKLIPTIRQAAKSSAVAADKSTEAATAATAEHAQSTLVRKYSK